MSTGKRHAGRTGTGAATASTRKRPGLGITAEDPRVIEVLRALPLLAGVPEGDVRGLAAASGLLRFRGGAVVVRHAPDDACLLLLAGRARRSVLRSAAAEVTLEIYGRGDLIDGGCWSPGGAGGLGRIVGIDSGLALLLRRPPLEKLLERNPRVAIRLVEATAARLVRALDRSARQACHPIADRLYLFLVDLAATSSKRTDDGLLLVHGMAQHELAACIGASREIVNRSLAEWKAAGLVEVRRRAILVHSTHGLTMAVSPPVRSGRFAAIGNDAATP